MPKRKTRNQTAEDILQNAAKTLLANIRFASVDKPISTLLVTSSIPNEGKSTVSVALAQAIATSGRTVLLVECDMRRRTLAGRLGVHCPHGMYSVLSGAHSLAESVTATSTPGMYFLDCEPHIPNPADILASRRFQRFVQDADAQYDYVIFDTPPLGPFVDAAVVSSVVDATILVVRERFTKRADILNSKQQLEKAGANLIGCVLNGTQQRENDYYYEYYNKDAEKDAPAAATPTAASAAAVASDDRPAPRTAAPAARPAAQAPQQVQAPRQVAPHGSGNRQAAPAPRTAQRPAARTAQRPQQAPVAGTPGARPVSPSSTAAMINMFRDSQGKK